MWWNQQLLPFSQLYYCRFYILQDFADHRRVTGALYLLFLLYSFDAFSTFTLCYNAKKRERISSSMGVMVH